MFKTSSLQFEPGKTTKFLKVFGSIDLHCTYDHKPQTIANLTGG